MVPAKPGPAGRARQYTGAASLAVVVIRAQRGQISDSDWQVLKKVYNLDDLDYDLMKPNRIMAEFAAESGIPVLDLLPRFVEVSKSKRLYWYHDGHWNAAGHRVAAEEIYKFLLEKGLL